MCFFKREKEREKAAITSVTLLFLFPYFQVKCQRQSVQAVWRIKVYRNIVFLVECICLTLMKGYEFHITGKGAWKKDYRKN
ncbi:hypothetical protein [Lacrimispora sp.]|uniref:hypothetical protein n=1 Tax=Lacrimispora sp. TaxID=2719234 RepID=UPI0039917D90